MSILVCSTPFIYVNALKLGKQRCVLQFKDLKINQRATQRAKKYTISVDKAFEQVLAMCVKVKGENWLCPLLQQSFTYLHFHRDKFRAKFHSFEVWDGDVLVAGELGYSVGSIYTSLSGAYEVSNTGTIQLNATGRILEKEGYKWWDFEMSHPYKLDLGAKEVSREDWLVEYHASRDEGLPGEDGHSRASFLCCTEKVNARAVLQGNF
eukprot:TRINITY_DN3961_c0_g1_i4.p1 TRINITY_DN3961_c0_g1~~TRINITY_DN3961_c0_g1_i4.p1  ORF type:complete len:208 (-),score=32.32 TRINITY_DN3961_c0_g1_i4:99-722(-)